MKRSTIELTVGIFVLIGILAVAYLTVRLGRMEIMGEDHYVLKARFHSITGLKTGARVEISGVEVGKVARISLDQKTMAAMVEMKLKKGLEITDDAIASVRTSGLIGDKYIKLSPGGSDVVLKDGEVITETESALDIEELIGKYVFGKV